MNRQLAACVSAELTKPVECMCRCYAKTWPSGLEPEAGV